MNTLRHNLDSASLCSKGEALPHTGLMLMLAHDVACGLQHIHSQNIIHGDLKALNVLLCSSTRKVLFGDPTLPKVIAKVSDFGMSARLKPEETHVSNVHSGTVTHMAPEVLLAGKLSKAADVYAFGILLFEMFSAKRAFEGMSMQQVIQEVGNKGARPRFPPEVPVRVVELACRCWGPAAGRPAFGEVVDSLQEVSMSTMLQRSVGFNYQSTPDGSQENAAESIFPSPEDSVKAMQLQRGSSSSCQSASEDSIRSLQMQGVRASTRMHGTSRTPKSLTSGLCK